MTEPVGQTGEWTRLGILAGGGDLPLELAEARRSENPFIVELSGFADRDYSAFETTRQAVGQIGGVIKALKAAGCDAICFAGYVTRPDFSALKMDTRGLALLPKVLAAARKGDDALIRAVVSAFEQEGFRIVGADTVKGELIPSGPQDAMGVDPAGHEDDTAKACEIARQMGALDIGQGAVVADGLVLAVEAQEGTMGMLERVAGLPAELRGSADQRRGVLAKMPKPIQERRVDLPTIGLDTVEACHRAGLAGIALEAGGAIILEREQVRAALQAHGLFVVIVDPPHG
ncbi:LpxI family protein [Maricaulis parjimensis]|uniref:LpxI family protein n=1 Tax=Maricaulis parjimensis TaxID=144023 RepID=UPI00193981EA|nr:UDP-2,3-diacylglucosamine diphosphatase LpxI [Maricaulis parjimensis]